MAFEKFTSALHSKPKLALGTASILVLVGCSMPARITTPPVTASLTTAGKALSEKQLVPIELRTFEDTAAGDRVWLEDLVGVSCELNSAYFTAEAVTPARILVPQVHGGPASFTATCKWNGRTVSRENGCYYHVGEPDSTVTDKGTCVRSDLSVIFDQ